jgi:hypothetical protein
MSFKDLSSRDLSLTNPKTKNQHLNHQETFQKTVSKPYQQTLKPTHTKYILKRRKQKYKKQKSS